MNRSRWSRRKRLPSPGFTSVCYTTRWCRVFLWSSCLSFHPQEWKKNILGQVPEMTPPPKNSHQSMNPHVARVAPVTLDTRHVDQSCPLTFNLYNATTPTPTWHTAISQTRTTEGSAQECQEWRPGGLPKWTNAPCSSKCPTNASRPKACEDSGTTAQQTQHYAFRYAEVVFLIVYSVPQDHIRPCIKTKKNSPFFPTKDWMECHPTNTCL